MKLTTSIITMVAIGTITSAFATNNINQQPEEVTFYLNEMKKITPYEIDTGVFVNDTSYSLGNVHYDITVDYGNSTNLDSDNLQIVQLTEQNLNESMYSLFCTDPDLKYMMYKTPGLGAYLYINKDILIRLDDEDCKKSGYDIDDSYKKNSVFAKIDYKKNVKNYKNGLLGGRVYTCYDKEAKKSYMTFFENRHLFILLDDIYLKSVQTKDKNWFSNQFSDINVSGNDVIVTDKDTGDKLKLNCVLK